MPCPHILFINRVLPPDSGATGRCLHELATRLGQQGWQVTVLADGKPGQDNDKSYTVIRTGGESARGLWRGRLGTWARLFRAVWSLPRADIIVTLTDPPLLSALGLLLKFRWRASAVHWCHDLYPDILPVLGVHLPKPVLTCAVFLSRLVLRRHDSIVATGDCMAAHLVRTGVPASKITVIENWAEEIIAPQSPENSLRATYAPDARFVVMHAGNYGLAHEFDTVLEAANCLQHAAPDIVFLMAGAGRNKKAVEQKAKSAGLANMRFVPFVPAESLPALLAAADVHLAVLKPEAAGLLVPSRIYSALASGKPCLFVGPENSGAAHLLETSGAGKQINNGKGEELAAQILLHANNPARHIAACDAACRLAERKTALHAVNAFARILNGVLSVPAFTEVPAWAR